MLQLYSYPSGSNSQCIIRFIGTYVQELHKNQIKNDEPQLYTCTIKYGKERAKYILVVEQGEAECPYCALLHAEGTHDSSPTPCDGRPPILHGLHENI